MNGGECLDPRARTVAILVNPTAGSRPGGRAVDELIGALRYTGFEPVIYQDREEFTTAVGRNDGSLRCVVAAGGDGTFAEVLNRSSGIPVALLPLGNENLAARHFRCERSGVKLARSIAAGRIQAFDLGQMGGRRFALMASAGFDADVVHQVHCRRCGQINKLSYLGPIWRAFHSYRFPAITVEIEDTGERLRGTTVFVFNLPRYALGLPIAPWARADDGLLDLCVFERPGGRHVFRYLLACLRHRQKSLRDFHHRLVRRVRLSSDLPVPLQTDGDPAGFLPAFISVEPGAMKFLLANCT